MNTRFEYMYRDGANNKQCGAAVFEGEISRDEWATVMDARDEGLWIIASQVGLRDVQLDALDFPLEVDHVWCEVDDDPFVLTAEPADSGPIAEFVSRFVRIEWDEAAAAERLRLATIDEESARALLEELL